RIGHRDGAVPDHAPRHHGPDAAPAERAMTRRRSALSLVAVHVVLIAGALATLTPLVWMVSASLMPTGQANTFPPQLLPREVTWAHYRDLFTRADLARYFLNSTVVSVLATLIALLVNSMAGYAFAKLRFRGRAGVFRTLLGALVIPAQVGMLPLFLLLRAMGLVNTLAAA